MRQHRELGLRIVTLAAAILGGAAPAARAGTVTWQGDVSTNWATAGNWDGDAVPGPADDVVINGVVTHHPALNLAGGAVTLNSLVLGSGSASTLTVWYADAALNKLIVAGNCTIGPNGVLTHPTNATAEVHRLNMQVDGDLTVSSGGRITGFGKGFPAMQGPGKPGVSSTSDGYCGGAGHGGEGSDGHATNDAGGTVYGSITTPTALGSGGKLLQGGGAVILNVAGLTTVSGTIDANAPTNLNAYPAGSGGSVFLSTGSLGGSGTISANGGACSHARSGQGGGGRVAVVLTNSADFGSVVITAYGGGNGYTYAGITKWAGRGPYT